MTGNERDSTGIFLADVLIRMAEKANVLLLSARGGIEGLAARFAEMLPGRCKEVPGPVQNALLMAAGLAQEGFRVVVDADSAELLNGGWSALRSLISRASLPVTLLGASGGFSRPRPEDEIVLDDLALFSTLPGFTLFVPADRDTLAVCLKRALAFEGPSCIRLGGLAAKASLGAPFDTSGGRIVRNGDAVSLFACGIMVAETMRAAELLEQQGIEADVVDCFTVKPLPEQLLLASVRRTACCVVAEDHAPLGGLGTAVAELLCRACPAPMLRVSAPDSSTQSGGGRELRDFYGLTRQQIVGAAAQVLGMRRRI